MYSVLALSAIELKPVMSLGDTGVTEKVVTLEQNVNMFMIGTEIR